MMRSGWLRMLVAALSLFASPTPGGLANAQDNVIRWATNPNYPPYDWAIDEQHYAGAASELLKLVAPAGYELREVLVPWVRAQEMARRGEIDLLVNVRITPERSVWLQFSKNPTFYNPIVVFMRRDRTIPLKSWDELKPLRGGVTMGDAFGNGFDEYLKASLSVEAIPNMSGNFRKLNAGRIDYFVSGYYMGMAWLAQAGLQERIVALQPPISKNYIHLGFSRLSPHAHLLPGIDRRLAELNADGTLDRLLKEQLAIFSAQPRAVFGE